MGFAVRLSASAEHDLAEIVDYISRSDSPEKAHYVLDHLVEAIQGLSAFPERGSYPCELLVLGIREYRQVFFKPYRVIYRLEGKQVQIFLIADGRRDMKALLARRLLGG